MKRGRRDSSAHITSLALRLPPWSMRPMVVYWAARSARAAGVSGTKCGTLTETGKVATPGRLWVQHSGLRQLSPVALIAVTGSIRGCFCTQLLCSPI